MCVISYHLSPNHITYIDRSKCINSVNFFSVYTHMIIFSFCLSFPYSFLSCPHASSCSLGHSIRCLISLQKCVPCYIQIQFVPHRKHWVAMAPTIRLMLFSGNCRRLFLFFFFLEWCQIHVNRLTPCGQNWEEFKRSKQVVYLFAAVL
jgi:hypothetical protein